MEEVKKQFCPHCGTLNDDPAYFAELSDQVNPTMQRSDSTQGPHLIKTGIETYESQAKYKCKHCNAKVNVSYSQYRYEGAHLGIDTGQKKPYFKDNREDKLKGEIEQEVQRFHQRMERAERYGQKRRKSLMEAEEIAYHIMRLDKYRYSNFGGNRPGEHDRLVKIPQDMLNPPLRDEDTCECECHYHHDSD